MKTKIFIALLIFSLCKIVCAANPVIIKFATEATYPPFEYMSPTGEIKGFDIDIAKALCKEIKAECTFSHQPFEGLIPSLEIGKFDAVISAMAITDERKKVVDFSNSYYQNAVSFVAPIKIDFAISDQGLQGKTIGVQAGTTFEQFLQATYAKNIKINTYASQESAFADMEAGRIDAVVGDTPLVQQWIKEHGSDKYHLVDKPINDVKFFGQGDGIAIKKGNTELLNKLNKALTTIKVKGIYTQIKKQYFNE